MIKYIDMLVPRSLNQANRLIDNKTDNEDEAEAGSPASSLPGDRLGNSPAKIARRQRTDGCYVVVPQCNWRSPPTRTLSADSTGTVMSCRDRSRSGRNAAI